MPKPKEFKVSS